MQAQFAKLGISAKGLGKNPEAAAATVNALIDKGLAEGAARLKSLGLDPALFTSNATETAEEAMRPEVGDLTLYGEDAAGTCFILAVLTRADASPARIDAEEGMLLGKPGRDITVCGRNATLLAGETLTMGPFELGDHIGVQFTRIGQGRIDAVLRVYGPNDAHCCPSLTRKDNFRYGPKGIDEFGGVIGKPGARNGGPSGQDEQTIKHYSLASLGIPQAGASTAAPAQPTPPETKKTSGSLNDILARNHITAMPT